MNTLEKKYNLPTLPDDSKVHHVGFNGVVYYSKMFDSHHVLSYYHGKIILAPVDSKLNIVATGGGASLILLGEKIPEDPKYQVQGGGAFILSCDKNSLDEKRSGVYGGGSWVYLFKHSTEPRGVFDYVKTKTDEASFGKWDMNLEECAKRIINSKDILFLLNEADVLLQHYRNAND